MSEGHEGLRSHQELNDELGGEVCEPQWIDHIEQHYQDQIQAHRMSLGQAQRKIDEATWIRPEIRNHIKTALSNQTELERKRQEAILKRIRQARGQAVQKQVELARHRIHRYHHYYYVYRDKKGRFTKHK